MTVQELFKSVNINEFLQEYFEYDNNLLNILKDISKPAVEKDSLIYKAKQKIIKSFVNMQNMPITKKEDDDYIVFAIPAVEFDCPSSTYYDTFLIKREDLLKLKENPDEYVETYAYDFEDTSVVLGYQVAFMSDIMIERERLAAIIFFEITFNGYDEEVKKARIKEVLDSLNESLEEIKNGNYKSYSVEEVFSELGVSPDLDRKYLKIDKEIQKITVEANERLKKEIITQEIKYNV